MINKILNFADEYDMLPESGTLLLCVSGGADSMCLLEAMGEISAQRGFTVCAAHYNHRLRGGESDRDEMFVREQCEAREVPLYSGCGDTRAYAKKHGFGIEEAAREMRYGFFCGAAEEAGAKRIVTAHTADDNAETIIMNLTRGAGAAGLSGIAPKRGAIIRPMLRVSRVEVAKYLSNRGVLHIEDSTNSLDIYTRNKLRHAVMPILREINPKFNEAAAAAAEVMSADEGYLSGLADEFIAENCGNLPERDGSMIHNPQFMNMAPLAPLAGLPRAISSRVVRKLCGRNLSYKHVDAVLKFCSGNGPPSSLSLPGITVYREYGRIVFGQPRAPGGFAAILAEDGLNAIIPGLKLKMSCKSVVCDDRINESFTTFLFKSIDICGKITVRPRQEGDTIKLLGRNGTKTLKKLFIERRIPARERALVPVVADDAGILAVYGLGISGRAVPAPGDPAFRIEFEKGSR